MTLNAQFLRTNAVVRLVAAVGAVLVCQAALLARCFMMIIVYPLAPVAIRVILESQDCASRLAIMVALKPMTKCRYQNAHRAIIGI